LEEATCKKCGNLFERPVKGYKKSYCSKTCANSRAFTEDTNERRKQSNQKYWENRTPDQIEKFGLKMKSVTAYENNFMNTDFESLQLKTKHRRVMIEQERKCLQCGLSDWMGNRITLELDHINGNSTDNTRSNLRYLCPNCHSQTDTWRGRNNTGNKNSRRK
jgi:Zn finger protein HypA/HybF involved in hydrogenase expression